MRPSFQKELQGWQDGQVKCCQNCSVLWWYCKSVLIKCLFCLPWWSAPHLTFFCLPVYLSVSYPTTTNDSDVSDYFSLSAYFHTPFFPCLFGFDLTKYKTLIQLFSLTNSDSLFLTLSLPFSLSFLQQFCFDSNERKLFSLSLAYLLCNISFVLRICV